MSNTTLKNRILNYENAANFKLLSRVPLVITINGRSFSKTTSLLEKPFCHEFIHCMSSCLLKLAQEIDGCLFGYSFNDELVLVARNDQTNDTVPWFDNDVQKIASAVSSIATLQFHQFSKSAELNLLGDAVFTANVFAVPNIMEAINVLVAKQQQAFQSAVQFSCLYELLKKYNKNDIKDMLSGTSYDEKIDLLMQECDVDFNNDYPLPFRRGVACYRAPTVVEYEGEKGMKNKWKLDAELPIFTKEHQFLGQIMKSGADIFRK